MKTRVVGEETFTIKPLCSQRKYNWNPRGQISGKFIVQNKGREFVHATTGTRKTCVFHDLFFFKSKEPRADSPYPGCMCFVYVNDTNTKAF